jgi:beta-phosphoglucomutase-like phosphatase (HAD superfamily)
MSVPEGRIQAVIFDMDGVLVDARDWHYEALNRALGLFGFSISRLEHLVIYDGLPTRTKLKMLSAERDLPVSLHDFINSIKQKYTAELAFVNCKPTFFHQYALSRLRDRGYRLAMASNSVRQSVDLIVSRCGLSDFFEFTLSNEDVDRPKPAPDIYTAAIERLGLSPDACLVVEDNENGIRAATEAGAHVMVVRSPHEVTLLSIEQSLDRFNEVMA